MLLPAMVDLIYVTEHVIKSVILINTSKLTKYKLDRTLGTKRYFQSHGFMLFRSFGHFFGLLVFYLFGPLDSV